LTVRVSAAYALGPLAGARIVLKLGAMMPHRRNGPAAQRFAERRQRENDAPKLRSQAPTLESLQLEIEDSADLGVTKYIRTFMVDHAPALFLVPCSDPRCLDGGHDLTREVMGSLRALEASFRGRDDCPGSIGPSPCRRVLKFRGTAAYRPGSGPVQDTFGKGTPSVAH